jgi:hypothetical protein
LISGETRVAREAGESVELESSENRDSETRALCIEIAISDFPRVRAVDHSGTRGQDPGRVGVRHFGVLAYKEIAAGEIAIPRYPIEHQGDGDVEERELSRASEFGIS